VGGRAARTGERLLSIEDVIAELDVPRATFYRWRQLGRGPKSVRLPNGKIRIRQSALDEWLASLEEDDPAVPLGRSA